MKNYKTYYLESDGTICVIDWGRLHKCFGSNLKIKKVRFFPGQKPFICEWRSKKNFYLWDDFEGKAAYEKKLLLKATKQNADKKPTSKRRM